MYHYSDWIFNSGDISMESPGKIFKCILYNGENVTFYSTGKSSKDFWQYTVSDGEIIPKDKNVSFAELICKYQWRDSTTYDILLSIVNEPVTVAVVNFDGEDFSENA